MIIKFNKFLNETTDDNLVHIPDFNSKYKDVSYEVRDGGRHIVANKEINELKEEINNISEKVVDHRAEFEYKMFYTRDKKEYDGIANDYIFSFYHTFQGTSENKIGDVMVMAQGKKGGYILKQNQDIKVYEVSAGKEDPYGEEEWDDEENVNPLSIFALMDKGKYEEARKLFWK